MQDRDLDIAMRALFNETADAYNEKDFTTVQQNLPRLVHEYLPVMGRAEEEIMMLMVVMMEGSGVYDDALTVLRKLADVTKIPAFMMGLRYFRAVSVSGARARFSDFSLNTPVSGPGRQILIACIPKTGSTFLQSTLMMIMGASGPKLGLSYANEENMLHPETVLKTHTADIVAQEHCRATPQNLAVAQGLGMQVVVLTRNIFDNLVSMRDMLCSETHGSVIALFQRDMPDMDAETQMDAIITKWAHWQLDFYTSWVRARREGLIDALFWTYEDIMYDKVASVTEICRQLGIQTGPSYIRNCVETVDGNKDLSRKNVGISGRGREVMTDRQIESIQAMTRFYPDIDFSALGL